ncbi:VOC family protein [Actinomadura vinacea]|uniref:VOC family protein n=1 Tax=Actinomadura vinacea TaxID=115336 RepID=A0ABP5W240_9ACTN
MGTVSVRYIVDDVGLAAEFYRDRLGFEMEFQAGSGFAMLSRGDLRLLLSPVSGPGGASQPMPDGRRPEPGGWNRFQIEVADMDRAAAEMREAGVRLRSEVIEGAGGKQLLIEDPAGNPVELFEPVPRG